MLIKDTLLKTKKNQLIANTFTFLSAARHQAALLEEEPAVAEEHDEEGPPEAQKVEFPDDKMGAKVKTYIQLFEIFVLKV